MIWYYQIIWQSVELMQRLIEAACRVHMGTQRENNEDNIYFNGTYLREETRDQPAAWESFFGNIPQIYAVCDGMGGEQLGELASLLAVETFHRVSAGMQGLASGNLERALEFGVTEANQLIYNEQVNRGIRNIGTTLAMLAVSETEVYVLNVGDSRAYFLRDSQLRQVSEDHTTVMRSVKMGLMTMEEARVHPHRNRLTQFLGINPEEMLIEPHKEKIIPNSGDMFMLCSDGLTDVVGDAEIAEILISANRADEAAQNLLAAALANRTPDNVTVIVIKIQN